MSDKSTTTQRECTCPRGSYSQGCRIVSHRNIACEIDSVFPRRFKRRSKKSYRKRDWITRYLQTTGQRIEEGLCRIMGSKTLNNALLLVVLGFLIITIAAQLQMKFVDRQKAEAVKVQAAKLKEQNRDLNAKVKILKNTNAELLGAGPKVPYVGFGGK